MRIERAVVTEWLNHIADCRLYKRLMELRLRGTPYYFPDSEEQRAEISRSIHTLSMQLELFDSLIGEFPDEQRTAFRRRYLEYDKQVEAKLLNSGKRQIVVSLSDMSLQTGVTSEGWPVFFRDGAST